MGDESMVYGAMQLYKLGNIEISEKKKHVRLSFIKIVKGGQKLNVENFGGAIYGWCPLHTNCLGGSGGMPPQGFFGAFRPSEVISGAFSDHITCFELYSANY